MANRQPSGNENASLLKCCFRECSADAPQCSRGAHCVEDAKYAEAITSAPMCPACHVTCSLYDPQCSRGIEFRGRWQAGEETPARRIPPQGRPAGQPGSRPSDDGEDKPNARRGGHRPQDGHAGPGRQGGFRGPKSTEDKLMFLLAGVVPRVLSGLDGGAEQKLLSALSRQGGAMSRDVIPEKTRIDDAKADKALDSLVDANLVEPRQCDWGTTYYWVTGNGTLRCKELEAERDKAVKEAFSALSDEEQGELASLLDKLLAANRPR